MEIKKDLISQLEAARYLGVTTETLRDYRRRGILRGIVISKRNVLCRRSEIERMLDAHTEDMQKMRNEQDCNEKKWLTPKEAANLLAVTTETLRRYRQRGKLKAVVVNARKIMFQRAELERFLTAHMEK